MILVSGGVAAVVVVSEDHVSSGSCAAGVAKRTI